MNFLKIGQTSKKNEILNCILVKISSQTSHSTVGEEVQAGLVLLDFSTGKILGNKEDKEQGLITHTLFQTSQSRSEASSQIQAIR